MKLYWFALTLLILGCQCGINNDLNKIIKVIKKNGLKDIQKQFETNPKLNKVAKKINARKIDQKKRKDEKAKKLEKEIGEFENEAEDIEKSIFPGSQNSKLRTPEPKIDNIKE